MKSNCWIFLLLIPILVKSQKLNESIRLNQIGFFPNGDKKAVITTPVSENAFFLTTTNLRDTVYSGQLRDSVRSRHSALVTRVADFSAFTQKGSYVLTLPGLGHSYVFQISDHVFQEVGKASLKAFYFQRTSMPLEPRYAGKWHRSSGHTDMKVLIHSSAVSPKRPSGTLIASPGGWYDAGDYNKYIVNSGITMSTLLSAYEHHKEYYNKLLMHIPESENQIPDILDEVIYNLRWMLTMQDPEDGGIYHKCTNAAFDDMVMPGITKEPRYVVQKSTAAALDFTAVMAQSTRILASFNKLIPGLSDSCRIAAQKAWNWALVHPALIYAQDQMNEKYLPKITTGSYGDGNLNDEWLWAAAEMYRITKDTSLLQRLDAIQDMDLQVPTWNNVGLLALYTLLEEKVNVPESRKKDWLKMQNMILSLANQYVKYQESSAFNIPMGLKESDFVWGSNSNAANQGILLIAAYRIQKNAKFLNAALSNADYLLGRNATGYCFITGYGSKSPMHPHHRPSIADGITEPVPGFLAGGPNPFQQDHCVYQFNERETSYTDDDCSYASNEVAINWNAPAVYLFNAIEALMKK